jgi:hypothetical protein
MDGRPAKESSMLVPVMPGYFRTMGGRVLRGREFTDAEAQGNARVAVVNERFAGEFGSPANALGHEVTIGSAPPWRIIGTVKGMDYMTDGANVNQIYVPDHSPGSFFSTFVTRVNSRAEDRMAMIRDTIRSVDPQVPVFGVKPWSSGCLTRSPGRNSTGPQFFVLPRSRCCSPSLESMGSFRMRLPEGRTKWAFGWLWAILQRDSG